MKYFRSCVRILAASSPFFFSLPLFSQENSYDPSIYLKKDSDYLDLEVKQSMIPNAGKGLFALKDFEPDDIIAEFRGPVVDSNIIEDKIFDDEINLVYLNENYSILCRSIAGFCNDCIKFPEKMTKEEYQNWVECEEIDTHSDCKYNAFIDIRKNKAFLVATQEIKPGEEIHIYYGFYYWDPFFKKIVENS